MTYIVAISAYLVLLTIFGLIVARKKVKTSDDMVTGGHRIPFIILVGTLLATWCGGGGITGSASGGLTIALELFGETFISWGYTPEIIHRVASIACGGLDTLPWNGTVVMLFALSGVSYKKGYKHVAMETVILPLLSLIPVFIYYSIVH